MLRFADELLLLLIDDKQGDLIPIPEWSLSCALAGALLMDLALEGRIDTDPDSLSLLDATPLDDDLLDPVLAEVAASDALRPAGYWVSHFAERGVDVRDQALARLTAQGILEVEEGGRFRLQARRGAHPPLPGGYGDSRGRATAHHAGAVQQRDSRSQGRRDHRPGGCLRRVRAPAAPRRARMVAQERIALLGRMDLIGRAVTEVIEQAPGAEPHRIPSRDIPVVRPSLNDLLLGRAFVLEQYRKWGPIFQVRKNLLIRLLEAMFITKPLGQRGKKNDGSFIFLAGTEANRFFAKNDRAHFRNREFWMRFDEQFDLKAARSTISTSGEDHFRMRRAKRSGFSRAVGEVRLTGIVDVTRGQIASWPGNKPVTATAMGKRLVYDLMCRLMAGISAPEYYDDFITLFEAAFRCVHGMYPGRLHWHRLRRARKRVDELTAKIVALHEPEHRGDRLPDVIDHLLALYRSDPQFLPETDLGIAILEPIYAPLDTMAHVVAFMLYELLRDPDLLRRARSEADELFAQGAPTPQDVQELDVIRRTYMETLRLHSVVPLTIRTVTNSFTFAGCTVPAGRPVILPFTLPHHMAEYFPDPERFDIDRFAPPRNEHQQPGVYMPYGVGTHRCLGAQLAEFTTTTAMATLLHDVELALDPPDYVLTERKIRRIPTRHPGKSFRFRLVRRRSAAAAPAAAAAAD